MEQAFSIWSPVIIAELKSPRKYQGQVVYQTDQSFKSLEDIKIKVRKSEVNIQGKVIETIINIDILFLVQDDRGQMQLITRRENIRDRVPLLEFNHSLKDRQIKLILNISNVSGEGRMRRRELSAAYTIEYMLLAVKDQVVRLFTDENGEVQRETIAEIIHQLEEQLTQALEENEELRDKMYFYERDIKSLKIGVDKLEKRNYLLNRNINTQQDLIKQLQEAIRTKEKRLNLWEQSYPADTRTNYRPQRQEKTMGENVPVNWGSRLKRALLSIFL